MEYQSYVNGGNEKSVKLFLSILIYCMSVVIQLGFSKCRLVFACGPCAHMPVACTLSLVCVSLLNP